MIKKHICELCSSEFTAKSSLSLHKKQIHEKIRYSCEQCEKSYTSKQNLEQHMQSVHEKINIIVFTAIPVSRRHNLTKIIFNLSTHQ